MTYGESLDPARNSFGIERDRKRDRRVEIPVDRIGNKIEKDGRGQRGQENRNWPSDVETAQPGAEQEDHPETKIPGNHPGIE